MGTWTVRGLRVVIAIALAGSLVMQGAIAPLLWLDLDDVVIGGVAVVVVVLRFLLAQAVALDLETTGLRSELDGVI